MQIDFSSAEKRSTVSPVIAVSNPPPVFMQSTQARQKIQNDAQSAAALVALQNVKNQVNVIKTY